MRDQGQADQILVSLGKSKLTGFGFRCEAMRLISELDGYDWAGIYRYTNGILDLDAFWGEPTEHTQIEVGVGVCGTAVAENINQVIEDVRNVGNYLSCSMATRSEIVVLFRDAEGKIMGQIDVDGHEVGTFDAADEAFLEALGALIVQRWV